MFEKILDFLPPSILTIISKFFTAVFILAVAIAIFVVTRKFIEGLFEKKISKLEAREKNKMYTAKDVIINIYKYIFIFFVIVMVLGVFNINATSILTVAGVGGIAIGFGAQSLVKDFLTGALMWFEDQIAVGDLVTILDKTGLVEEFNFRTVKIRSFDGDLHIIPNGEIREVTNKTREFRRAIIDIDVSYSEDIDKAMEIIKDELEKSKTIVEGVTEDVGVLGVSEIKSYAITIKFYAKCEPMQAIPAERELRKRVRQRLDAENIAIPFPQMTIHEQKNDKQ